MVEACTGPSVHARKSALSILHKVMSILQKVAAFRYTSVDSILHKVAAWRGRLLSCPKFGEREIPDPAPPRQRNFYRDLIRNVAVSRGQYIRQSAYTWSSSSGASDSYPHPSTNSDCSSGSGSAAATADFSAQDNNLTSIACQMVRDGYARRMVNAFGGGGGADRACLETWFLELDVDWVLQLHEKHGLRPELQDKTAASLQELIDRWIRALTVIAVTMADLVLVVTADETLAVARFGKASMAKMLVFVDAIIPALKEEKLRAVIEMYVCVSGASYSYRFSYNYRFRPLPISPEAQTMLNEIGRSLSRKVTSLKEAISSTMEEVRTLVEDDDSWAILIQRGRGEVHQNTRFMVDCIRSMVKAEVSMQNTANLHGLIDDSVNNLKDLLLRKSKLCSDPSLRYLFLLNNFYVVAQLSEPRPGYRCLLTPECKKFMDSYLDVSWGHVLSHIQKMVPKDTSLDVSYGHVLFCVLNTGFHESRQHPKKTSSLAKFESAFHKVYQDQKFWKVPDPQLRNALRNTIIERLISDYSWSAAA